MLSRKFISGVDGRLGRLVRLCQALASPTVLSADLSQPVRHTWSAKAAGIVRPNVDGRIIPNSQLGNVRAASSAQLVPVNVSASITINGSAGTDEQNRDLADQIAKAMTAQVRGIISEELRQQLRPWRIPA
jgi:hypothetical protein